MWCVSNHSHRKKNSTMIMILRAIIKVFIWSLPRTKLVTSSRYLHIIWRNEYFDIQMCRSNRFHFLDILSLYFYISNHVSIILKRLPNCIIRNIFISLNTFIVFDSSIKWKKTVDVLFWCSSKYIANNRKFYSTILFTIYLLFFRDVGPYIFL